MTSSVHTGTTLRYQIVFTAYPTLLRVAQVLLAIYLLCQPIFQNDLAEVGLVTRHSLLQEYERRFEIWADTLDFIESYNSDDKTHWVS